MRLKPDQCTLVPEKREEITTEGGLDVVRWRRKIKPVVKQLKDAGITTSAFIEPTEEQVAASAECGFDAVELWTGAYANARSEPKREAALETLAQALDYGMDQDLVVHAGHGLTYRNIEPVAGLVGFAEFNIGHSIVSRAILVGLRAAVWEMKRLIDRAVMEACNLPPLNPEFEDKKS